MVSNVGRLSRGWKLAKMSLGVIKKDKEILIFPFLSLICLGIIAASFFGGIFLMGGFDAFYSPPAIAALVVMYLLLYFFMIYFNVAVIGCAMIRFEGGDPTVRDGFRTSNGNLWVILKWAIISATVGMILGVIQSRLKLAGRVIAAIGGLAWGIATYFAVPVLIYEKTSVFGAVKRSAHLLRSTWGEMIIGGLGLGLILALLFLLGLIPIFTGLMIGGLSGLIVGLIIATPYWLIIVCIGSAADSIFHTALYRYATTGKVAPGFSEEVLRKPWGERKQTLGKGGPGRWNPRPFNLLLPMLCAKPYLKKSLLYVNIPNCRK